MYPLNGELQTQKALNICPNTHNRISNLYGDNLGNNYNHISVLMLRNGPGLAEFYRVHIKPSHGFGLRYDVMDDISINDAPKVRLMIREKGINRA